MSVSAYVDKPKLATLLTIGHFLSGFLIFPSLYGGFMVKQAAVSPRQDTGKKCGVVHGLSSQLYIKNLR